MTTTKVNGIESLIEQTKLDIEKLEAEILDMDIRGVITPDTELDPKLKLAGLRVVLNSYKAVSRTGR